MSRETASGTFPSEERLDAGNPWPGLAAFREGASAFFHGRDGEIEDLERRVRRKSLTVLYGQSGLGKTSLLQAGLFPRLRASGFLPVSLRLDYADAAEDPAAQIRHALTEAFHSAGLDSGDRFASGSAWECFHRLEGDDGQQTPETDRPPRPIPVLVFDQFEELFTRAAGSGQGRPWTDLVVEELASLIENRPPRSLEARFENDPALVERFDFERQDYRVLLSLREDYLPHLHDLRREIPSVSLNSMRLGRMDGERALQAVLRPGRDLLEPPVAQAIVRFVAGAREAKREGHSVSSAGGDFRSLEVEPALLSLFCRELNQKRRDRGDATISLELVRGSREEILQEFYDGCFADQPPGVRAFVEEELLTESGFRESLTRERAEQELSRRGVAPGALDVLISRRLLQVEDRLRVQRVELTHDVLAEVARQSRAGRRHQEALEEAERQAAQARDLSRRARRRALVVGATALVIGGLLALGGLVAIQQSRIAREATTQAQVAESLAVQRAEDVTRLNRGLVDSATILSSQRDELGRQAGALSSSLRQQEELRREAESNANQARELSAAATQRLEQICGYSLALASALSAEVSSQQQLDSRDGGGGSSGDAASEVYQKYLQTTNQHFDSLYTEDPSATCVRQMRARVKVLAAGAAHERSQSRDRLRWSREGLPAVQVLGGVEDAGSQHLAQILYTDLAYYLWLDDDTTNAETAAVEGIAVSRTLDARRNRNAVFRYARLHQMYGNVWMDRKEYGRARQEVLAGLRVADSGLARPDQDSLSLLLAQSQLHLRMGALDTLTGARESATGHYAAAVASAAARVSYSRTDATVEWLARTREWLGDLSRNLGRHDDARTAWAEAIRTLQDTIIPAGTSLPHIVRIRRNATRMELAVGDTGRALQLLVDRLRLDSARVRQTRGLDASALDTLDEGLGLTGRLALATRRTDLAIQAREQIIGVRRDLMRFGRSSARANLAIALGNSSWSRLFGRQGARAVLEAVEGLTVDSSQTYIYTNLAHGLLMSGRMPEAEAVYRGCSAVRYGNPPTHFAEVVRQDLVELRAAGALDGAQVAQAERWLASPRGQCAVQETVRSGAVAGPTG